MQQRPVLVASEQKLPILIIDKKGFVGSALAEKLQEQFLIVLVSGKELEVHKNIIHIPYRKKIPLIPDNTYSHMFIIYNGEPEMLEILPSFVKKANETNSKLLVITHLAYGDEHLFKRLSHQYYHNVQVIVFGELFWDAPIEENGVTNFINQVRLSGKIDIPNSGLGKLYPILFDEVLAVIIVTAFGTGAVGKPLLIFPKYSFTEFSVARILQRINPMVKLDFKKTKSHAVSYYIPDGEYYFPNYNLEERLRKLDYTVSEHISSKKQKKITLYKPRKAINPWLGLLLFFLGTLIVPLLMVLTLGGVGAGALQASFKEAEKTKFTSAKQYAAYAHFSFKTANTVLDSMFYLDILAQKQRADTLQKLEVGDQLSETMVESMDAAITLQHIYDDTSNDPKNDFMHATATLKNSLLVVQKLQAEGGLPKEVRSKLDEVKDVISLIENTIDTYPSLLGFEGKRTYLLLFQNNMELRPGGGFIGSYGLLEVDKGKMTKFKINDVYDADGQLKDHLEPPYPLRRYLGASHWYLRDSNFAVDFITNATQAINFLQLETGQKVDGVIAIDTAFLKNMLAVFGSVNVVDYKETVTPENFYLLTQTYAEKDFFPGSTQKKDFLRSLANTLLLELTEKKEIPYRKFLQKIGESIREKHLLFAFPDNATQQLFTVNNLSSSLWDGRKKRSNTFTDFLGVIDANLGTNKANYYLNRSVQQDVVIDNKGEVRTTVSVTYANTSTKTSAFGGDYKNYVRFIVPANASLQSVAIDKQPVQTTGAITDPTDFTRGSFIPPKELEVDETQVDGKTSIGFFVIIPTGSTKTVSITYSLPRVISVEEPVFTYDLRLFKQPGTNADPYALFMAYPSSFILVEAEKGIVDVGGKISFSTNLSTDKNIRASFSKK